MLDSRIRFRHLHCFLTIAQERSVGRAARALSISQPALSKTLRELEDALGVILFNRDKKGMTLTRFGEVFRQHTTASIASLRRGIDTIKMTQVEGAFEVAVGVLPNVSAQVMPLAVQMFKQKAPSTNVRILAGGNAWLLDLLRLGELDLVVGRLAQSEQMTGLIFEHLYSQRVTAAVRPRHPLASAKRVSIGMIGEFPFVIPNRDTIIRDELDRFLIAQGLPLPDNVVETTVSAFGKNYVRSSDAIWFVPRGAIEADIADGSLVELSINNHMMEGPVGLTTRADIAQTSATLLMIESVRKASIVTDDMGRTGRRHRESARPRH